MSSLAVLWVPPLEPAVQEPEPPAPPAPEPDQIPEPRLRWIGSPHFTRGRSQQVCAIVLHVFAGTLAGSDSWLQNPTAQVSYSFGIGLAGQQHQYVQLGDTPWANGRLEAGHRWPCGGGNPNAATVAIGTEDMQGGRQVPVTDQQYQATLEVAALAQRTFPSIRYVLTHRAISPGTRPACPGPRWTSGRIQALADRLGLQLIV